MRTEELADLACLAFIGLAIVGLLVIGGLGLLVLVAAWLAVILGLGA